MLDSEVASPTSAVLSHGSLKITEDIPGTRLSLSWTGPRPWGWLRVVVPLGAVLVFAFLGSGARGPFALAWEQIAGGGPRDITNDIILGLLICGGLYFTWICCGLLGQMAGYWHSVTFEGTEQLLTIERRGWGIFFGRKTVDVLFPRLQSLSLRAGQIGRGPFLLELRLAYRDRVDKLEFLTLSFPLIGCTRRGAALEFLLAIGRVVGATGYMNGESSPRGTSWQLVLPYATPEPTTDPSAYLDDDDDFDDEDDDSEDELDQRALDDQAVEDEDKIEVIPIPVVGDLGRDEEELVGATSAIVDYELAEKVNVEKINEKISFAKLVEWKPGERVTFLRERAPTLVFWIVAIFGALAGGGIGGWPLFGFLEGMLGQGVLWWPAAVGVSAAFGAAFVTFVSWNNFQEQTVDIVWSEQTIHITYGGVPSQESFESCRGLLVSGKTKKEYSGSDDNRTVSKIEYGCRLDLLLADRDVQLLESDGWEPSLSTAKNLLMPLGTSLAQSLGLKCDWADSHQTDAATIRRILQFTLTQYVTLGILLLIAVVGIGKGMTNRELRVNAGQAIRDLGGEAVWMNGFSMRNKSVYKEFWKVEFKDDPEIDAKLARLHAALVNVSELGIELEGCPLTDAGIAQLDGATGLRVFTAYHTQITDAGLASLSNCRQLVYLNLFGNNLTDAGVKHLSEMDKLRFLFVGGTQVTDAGLQELGKLKSLEYLQLTGSAVTEQGIQQLKATRPSLEVDFTPH